MSRGMPSMTALLGLLAIAGYQNRDKLAEMLKSASANNSTPSGGTQQPGLLGNLGGMLGGKKDAALAAQPAPARRTKR